MIVSCIVVCSVSSISFLQRVYEERNEKEDGAQGEGDEQKDKDEVCA